MDFRVETFDLLSSLAWISWSVVCAGEC